MKSHIKVCAFAKVRKMGCLFIDFFKMIFQRIVYSFEFFVILYYSYFLLGFSDSLLELSPKRNEGIILFSLSQVCFQFVCAPILYDELMVAGGKCECLFFLFNVLRS